MITLVEGSVYEHKTGDRKMTVINDQYITRAGYFAAWVEFHDDIQTIVTINRSELEDGTWIPYVAEVELVSDDQAAAEFWNCPNTWDERGGNYAR